ncbi:MAG: hypothetical protein H0V73_12435 [Chloroflexi bacterium]|nr:hypothetical protein [Chloroflexota bacterium]
MIEARFGHVNLIARDWRALARFYTDLFGCVLVPPERDYAGPDLERGTGVPGAALRGAHLRLPGLGPDGPTPEIYQFSAMPDGLAPAWRSPQQGPMGTGPAMGMGSQAGVSAESATEAHTLS